MFINDKLSFIIKNRGLLPAPFYHQFFLLGVTLPGGNSDDDHTNDSDNYEGSCTYYVITDRRGSLKMITVLHRGGFSQMITVLHRGGPANGYGIT